MKTENRKSWRIYKIESVAPGEIKIIGLAKVVNRR